MLGGMSLAVLTGIIVIGRLFGGAGTLDAGLRLFSWLQAVLIVFQVVQLVALILLPVLAALISIVSFGIFLWLLVVFTAEMHRFDGAGTAVFTIILAFTLTSFVLLIVISMLGIVPIPETPNV